MFGYGFGALRKKLFLRVTLLKRIAGYRCGVGAKRFGTAFLSLAYLTARYYASDSCSSVYICLMGSVFDNALCITT